LNRSTNISPFRKERNAMALNKPLVLILCTGNSCRSQMAEGFLRKYQGDEFDVQSAGTQPKEQVHPLAVEVMAEVGIDMSHQRPKSSSTYLGHYPVRHILIVCDKANMTCPRIWPGALTRTYLPFDDPAAIEGSDEEKLEGFRKVRDEIEQAMRAWSPEKAEPWFAKRGATH
jgi:arsenate reductase